MGWRSLFGFSSDEENCPRCGNPICTCLEDDGHGNCSRCGQPICICSEFNDVDEDFFNNPPDDDD